MNQTQKTNKCREILKKYDLNEVVSDVQDIDFLIALFENHKDWHSKQGAGIKSISVISSQFNNRCFQLNRIDGTYTDISFTNCIKRRSPENEIRNACRSAIRQCILAFRDDNVIFGESTCPITGDVLTKENTHIDHYELTFNEMFSLWLNNQDTEYLYSKVNETEDNSFETYFTDESIINDFIAFHNCNTKLRAVSKMANLSHLKYTNL